MAKDKGETPEEEKPKAPEGGAEGAPAEGDEAAAKKAKKKKMIIIIGAAVGLLIAVGAGLFFSGVLGGGHKKEAEEIKEKPTYYSMPQMLINLSSPGKQASFLKALIILELPHAVDAVTVEANLPKLMDAMNTYVRELRPSDLAGSAGITRLREELLLRVNKVLAPVKVNDVLFKEIVVQ